ncbi:polysaccharide deacetylase family protein [Actinopolymorpha pittospori]
MSPSSLARPTPPGEPSPRNPARGGGGSSPGAPDDGFGTPDDGPTSGTYPGDSTTSPSASPSASPGGTASPDPTDGPKVLYLTFDDGPTKYTPEILGVLAKHNAKATFFQLGEEIDLYPQYAADVRQAGHTIGNHTEDHKSLPSLSSSDIRAEISGGPSSKCLRPPYGAVNSTLRSIADDLGLKLVLWDVDTLDWTRPGVDKIESSIVDNAKSGRVILMHDGGGNRSQTVTALDRALTTLSARGYVFHSLDC